MPLLFLYGLPVQGITFIDVIIWVVLLGFVAKGFMKGLVREVCSLLGLVVGGWGAFKFYPAVATAVITPLIHLPQLVASVVAFLIIFLSLGALFYLLGHLLTVVLKIALLGGVNRVGGMVFGLAQGGLILCLLLYLGTTRPIPDRFKATLNKSRAAQSFAACGREIVAGWESRKIRDTAPDGATKR